ncbi:DoxX family protein [Limnoglobus roseus]|uniref:DoxX family protein n=1 Tax=Limnoglobus roseus TaxID=2598579 RepID=A0A5C1ACN5_9BACT|nr:DoxX family protein [Limnoglobus roseus]QEL17051.1 DoxX family protein [Limnoglobus roseus]
MTLPIPIQVLYAGLVGVLIALIVATAQQNWKPKVFFLLALRLAIGWQFLFEGLHKIQSHYIGATETNRPFSSEPYFKEAPGPLAPMMRAMNGDASKIIPAKLTPKKEISAADFAKLTTEEQAALCPDDVAKELDGLLGTAEKTIHDNAEKALADLPKLQEAKLKKIAETEKKETEAAKDAAAKENAKKKADGDRKIAENDAAETKAEEEKRLSSGKEIASQSILAAKAAFARWTYGEDRREVKMARISGDPVLMTGPQRLHYLGLLKHEKQEAEARQSEGLGGGYGLDIKKAQTSRADYWNEEAALVKDIDSFVTELKTKINDGKAPEASTEKTPLQRNDWLTRWFLAAVGAFILFGFLTRISCVAAAGFLLLTYLTHPPFPWFTLPPGTEGNPLFINKNAVEFFALLALACMPTGRWLGLDALIGYIFCGKSKAVVVKREVVPVKA